MTGSMVSRVLLSLAILAITTACEFDKRLDEGSTDTDGSTSSDPLALDNAAAAMAAARCSAYFACECETLPDPTIWTSQADCESRLEPLFDDNLSSAQAAGMTYDPACVAAYLAYYEGPGCAAFAAASDAAWLDLMRCPFFHGARQAGEDCEGPQLFPGNSDCAPGLVCAPSTCQAIKADGEPCAGDVIVSDCAYGSFCSEATDPPRCAPYPAAGEPCDDTVGCGQAEACLLGADPQASTCIDIAEPGEPCDVVGACAYGGTCDPQTDICVGRPSACTP